MSYVIAATQAAGAVTQTVVGMADAAAHIEDVVRAEAQKNKEQARDDDNEFNIRKNFLDNAVNAIKEATLSQFNIVICTDQEHDDFQDLQGQILPMSLLNLEISKGKFVNFQVYVFDTGKYLRHGKYERDYWWWFGETKKFFDPAAMHVHFDKAQTKLDPSKVQAAQAQNAQQTKTAGSVTAAGNATQATASANEAPELKAEAARKAAEAQAQAQGNQQADPYAAGSGAFPGSGNAAYPGSAGDPGIGENPGTGEYPGGVEFPGSGGYPDAAGYSQSSGSRGFPTRGGPGGSPYGGAYPRNPNAAPGFMSQMMGMAAGPAMKMFMG